MTNKKTRLGMLLMVLVFGFIWMGCSRNNSGNSNSNSSDVAVSAIDSRIPSELVGEWKSKGNPNYEGIEITANGKIRIPMSPLLDISVDGNKITAVLFDESYEVYYSITNGELTLSTQDPTPFYVVAMCSPFVKR